MTAEDVLGRCFRRNPSRWALEAGEVRFTYAELERRTDLLARRLRALGCGEGARLAVVASGGRAALELLHAGPRAGLEVAPLSPRLTDLELSAALDALRPSAVIGEGEGAARARACEDGWRVLEPGELEALPPSGEGPGPLPLAGTWYVIWTSGTSGRPKGVRITGKSLRASARASRERLALTSDDRWLASLSFAHVGGLALVTRAAFLGSTLVLSPDVGAAAFWTLAEAGKVSHASLVPVLLRRILEHGARRRAPPALRCILVGGARAPEHLLRRGLELGYPIALTYGMTETSSQVATAPPHAVRRKPEAVGSPLDGVEVRISEEGEIRVRGATLAAGYLGGEPLDLDAEGWLRTGDAGWLDDEGDLRVVGRRSDRIVTGGVTVDANEVEAAILSLSGVREAAVVGVPDPEWGERVAALVVFTEGPEEDVGKGRADRLSEDLRARLSGPKRPRRIVASTAAIPRTASGKVDRERVRELLSGP